MQPVLIGVLAYLAVQFAIGVLVSRRIASETDYVLAGRRLGLGLAAFSIFATWFGAETIVGAAGSIYTEGLSGGSADPFGYGLCLLVAGAVVAAPLWRRKYTTFGDLFRERYSAGVERVAIVLMVPTSVIWAAAQIRAFGQVVSAASDLEVSVAVTAAAVFVVGYTVVGGLLADAITDLVQGVALVVGLVVLLLLVANANGGLPGLAALVEPSRLKPLGTADTGWLEIAEAWAVPVLGSMLAVELLSRMLGCRSAATARNATLIGAALYVAVGLVPVLLGLAGPRLVPDLEEPEQLIAVLAERHLGTLAYVVFAGALISAILSTVDSALLAAASLISHNVVLPLRPTLGERAKVRIARLGVAGLGVAAYVIALHAEGIYALVETASAFGSSGIFVVGMFGLFSRFGGPRSALAALGTGMAVWALGEYALEWRAPYLSSLASAVGAYVGVALAGGVVAWPRAARGAAQPAGAARDPTSV